MKQKIIFNKEPLRLDVFLSNELNMTRSKISNLIKASNITINNNKVKSGYVLKQDDIIEIDIKEQEQDSAILPEKMDLDIVYEDADVIVVNKANGIVVHPAAGNYTNTLVNGLLYHSSNLSNDESGFRPGIVHRIDADTTGLLVIAKNDNAHNKLAMQLKEHTTHRVYNALVWGVIKNETGTIDAPVGRDVKDRKKMAVISGNSKEAITHFKVLDRFEDATLLELKLETGRTHQIRVHMNYIGHPIVNDPVYGRKKIIDDTGQCLHAKELGFVHPTTDEYMHFSSELPACFVNVLNIIKSDEEDYGRDSIKSE